MSRELANSQSVCRSLLKASAPDLILLVINWKVQQIHTVQQNRTFRCVLPEGPCCADAPEKVLEREGKGTTPEKVLEREGKQVAEAAF